MGAQQIFDVFCLSVFRHSCVFSRVFASALRNPFYISSGRLQLVNYTMTVFPDDDDKLRKKNRQRHQRERGKRRREEEQVNYQTTNDITEALNYQSIFYGIVYVEDTFDVTAHSTATIRA